MRRAPGVSRAKKLLLISMGIFAGALISEVVLRVAGYSVPEFYIPDQSRGYALRPGISGWYRKEGEAFVQINSDGMRDREHSKAKPSNTYRIAILGDSYPEAFPVVMEQAFWSVMERKAQNCATFAGRKLEVLNFGVSGYGTAQELLTLREHVWDYSPDLVILSVTTNNDITDNFRPLKRTDEIPYFVFREGKLTLDDSFKTSPAFVWRQSALSRFGRWLKGNSRLVQAVNQAHYGLKVLIASWKARLKSQPLPQKPRQADIVARSDELGTDNVVYLPAASPDWDQAWKTTEALIVTMGNDIKAHRADFLVVTLSNGPQVLPDAQARQAFMDRFGVTDLFYPDNRIKMFCERAGIPVLTLAPALQAYAEQHNLFLHGFGSNLGNGHWNPAGHAQAGELLAQRLCEPSAK